jgi:hypothetical protein
MRKRRWFLVIFSTFLASLARQQGIFLVFPIIWYAWEDSGKSLRNLSKAWQAWLAALATPLGLFAWTIYRLFYLREGIAEINNWQSFIYSVLLSPSAKKIFPDQALVWPWTAFMIALPKLISGPDIGDVMSLAIGLGFIVLFVLAWRYMQPAYRIYSLVIVLISLSMSTGSYRIYLSLPRHLLLAFPVFIGLTLALKKPWQRFTLIGLQFSIQTFMLFLYVAKVWIP